MYSKLANYAKYWGAQDEIFAAIIVGIMIISLTFCTYAVSKAIKQGSK